MKMRKRPLMAKIIFGPMAVPFFGRSVNFFPSTGVL
jgi:hypothetical protein